MIRFLIWFLIVICTIGIHGYLSCNQDRDSLLASNVLFVTPDIFFTVTELIINYNLIIFFLNVIGFHFKNTLKVGHNKLLMEDICIDPWCIFILLGGRKETIYHSIPFLSNAYPTRFFTGRREDVISFRSVALFSCF